MINPFGENDDKRLFDRFELFYQQTVFNLLLNDFVERQADPEKFYQDLIGGFRSAVLTKLEAEVGRFSETLDKESKEIPEQLRFSQFPEIIEAFKVRYKEALEEYINKQMYLYDNSKQLGAIFSKRA